MTSRKNILKIKVWLLPSLLLFVLAAIIILWLWIPSIIISKLSDYTYAKSDGQYLLTISNVNRSLFPLSLNFREVELEPVSKKISGNNIIGDEILYSFSFKEILVEGINLKLLLSDNNLVVNKIKFSKPEVKLEGEKLLQIDSVSVSPQFYRQLWPLFGFVQIVNIKKIELEGANFGFYSAAGDSNFISKAEKVSVDVYGFYTSKELALNPHPFFETEDILVRMQDFRNDMGDSLHFLTIDTLSYSLKTTDIHVKGFHLLPYFFQPEENLFEVFVPEVYLKSRSITHFALSDSLKIKVLKFLEPKIKFFNRNHSTQYVFENFGDFDLYSLIKGQFIKLEVDSFYLLGAHVEIFRQPDNVNYRQQFQAVDVILDGFELDSTSYLNRFKLLHADNLEMHVKEYHLKLEDDEHHFKAGSLFASTFSNRLSANEIHIYPVSPGNTGNRNEINIECEALNIEEVKFLDLYHKRILPTAKIEVVNPDVHLLYKLEKDKQEKQQNSGLLFDMVTDYLQGVYANSVNVLDGRLNIQNSHNEILKGYFETNIEFNLSDFRLDSASIKNSSNFFYASNFNLLFSDYNMRLTDDFHKLEVDTVFISSLDHQIYIENLRLLPVKNISGIEEMQNTGHSELFRILIPKINLRNVDLRNAFFNQKVAITEFSIYNPEIYFENFGPLKENNDKQELSEIYQLIFSYVSDIDVRQFSITGGLLTWINHTRSGRTTYFDNEFSVSLENFKLNEEERLKKRLLFSDNFDLTIKDQEFELSDDVHVLKGSEIRFSSAASKINVKNALLFPLITSDKYNELATTWQVAIPEINIEGFDFHKAYFSQEPEIKVLEVVKPRFQVYTQSGKSKGLDLKAYKLPMPSIIESFKISEFKITDGEAITYKIDGIKHYAMANFSFQLSVPDLLFDNNQHNQIQVSSRNIKFTASDFRIPIDNIHDLQINSVHFDMEKQSIEFLDVKVSPFLADESNNRFTIAAPDIQFKGFDFNAALTDNQFIFNSIDIINPDISIAINQEIENDTLEFLETLDLYPYVENLVNSIEVKNLDIRNASFNFNWLQKQLFNNKLNLSFEGILVSKDQPAHNLLNSQEFTFSTSGLSTRSKNQKYEFTADSLIYKSAKKMVSIKNIDINPFSDRRSLHLASGFQTDVVKAQIDYVDFREINVRRWLKENILEAGAIIAGPADIEIYRNKRFPFDENQSPEWPQDLIKDLKQPFLFDSVILMPSQIKYSELLGIFEEPGIVGFSDLTVAGGRLSNLKEEIKKNNLFHVNAEAWLYNEALLSVRFIFDMNSINYEHSVEGSLGTMDLKPLNAMIMKTAPIAVEDGILNHLHFTISFNDKYARGELVMNYDKLKIAILDYSQEEIQKEKFSSFLANNLKINSRNQSGSDHKPEEIFYERDKKRSIINFWWKSLYEGIATVIGISN